MKSPPLIVTQTFKASPESIWNALTKEELMKQWYFDLPGFKAEVGYKFSFPGGPDPEKPYIHHCEILEVIPLKLLNHSWTYEGHDGYTTVSFELFEEGHKTRVKLTHDGLETFSADNKDLNRKNFENGWSHIIGTSLLNFLEQKKVKNQ